MTTGALIFAYNNEVTDYVAMAEWSAKNIRRHLNIPVCIVSDVMPTTGAFDDVISHGVETSNSRHFSDYGTNVTWHNKTRSDAYSLSPYDQTLVLDADYVVASDQLKVVLDSQEDFLCHRWAYDITGENDFSGLNYFGQHRMPQWWATVMMFRRSTQAELIFNMMQMIRDNWRHYRDLYGNTVETYRNDHALSIALNTVNGHQQNIPGIPWNLASLVPEHSLEQINQDEYRVKFINSENKSRWISVRNFDFHAMGKKQLGEIVANNS
jgi:hypothetical protein